MAFFKYKKLSFLILIVLIYYVWIATAGTNKFNLQISNYGGYISYNHLADSFLEGKINLLVDPKPELLKLKDPYEPGANYNCRWQDASFYKNKFYFYWGAVPALVFYTPYKLLTGYYMPDNLVVLIFIFGGFLFSVTFLLNVRKKHFPNVSEWIILLLIGILGFSNISGFIIRQAGVYQVAISSGYFFLLASIYFIYSAIFLRNGSAILLFLSGMCLGFSVGSRANLCFSSLIIVYLSINELKKINNKPILKDSSALVLLISYGICLAVIGLYNYLRFNNPLEFGLKYQVGEINFSRISPFAIEYLYPNLYFNLFHPVIFNSVFPYFHFSTQFPHFSHIDYFVEKIAGMLTTTPFISLIVICSFLNYYKNKKFDAGIFKNFYFQLVFFSGCMNLLLIMLFHGVTMRYEADYANLLILAACFTVLYYDEKLKKIIRILSLVLGVYGMCVGAALGFTGVDNVIKHENPKAYNDVINFFKPLSCYLFQIKPNWENINLCVPIVPTTIAKCDDLYLCLMQESEKNKALDGKLDTEWITSKDTGIISLETVSPAEIKSLWLIPRRTSLIESWKKVTSKFYLNRNLISEQSLPITISNDETVQRVVFNPVLANSVELIFSEPNNIDFKNNVVSNSLTPGYKEIVLEASK